MKEFGDPQTWTNTHVSSNSQYLVPATCPIESPRRWLYKSNGQIWIYIPVLCPQTQSLGAVAKDRQRDWTGTCKTTTSDSRANSDWRTSWYTQFSQGDSRIAQSLSEWRRRGRFCWLWLWFFIQSLTFKGLRTYLSFSNSQQGP